TEYFRDADAGSWSLAKVEKTSRANANGPILAADEARSLAGRRTRRGLGRIFEAANGDLEAGNALIAGHRRLVAADRAQERNQFGAQRLVMADRQMPHRVAAVGLEAEALRDLAGEQIAHDIFVARRDRHVARLERRQPVGV